MAYEGGNLKSTSINGVKMYSVSGQRSVPAWLPPKKLRALRKDQSEKICSFFNSVMQVSFIVISFSEFQNWEIFFVEKGLSLVSLSYVMPLMGLAASTHHEFSVLLGGYVNIAQVVSSVHFAFWVDF